MVPTGSQSILVVEDSPSTGTFVAVVLRAEGYEVHTAADGESGLAAIIRFRPSLVLLDLVLPKLDGWQVLEKVKADPDLCEIPVIIFTAHAESTTKEKARESGASGVLFKPVGAKELVQQIQGVIGGHG